VQKLFKPRGFIESGCLKNLNISGPLDIVDTPIGLLVLPWWSGTITNMLAAILLKEVLGFQDMRFVTPLFDMKNKTNIYRAIGEIKKSWTPETANVSQTYEYLNENGTLESTTDTKVTADISLETWVDDAHQPYVGESIYVLGNQGYFGNWHLYTTGTETGNSADILENYKLLQRVNVLKSKYPLPSVTENLANPSSCENPWCTASSGYYRIHQRCIDNPNNCRNVLIHPHMTTRAPGQLEQLILNMNLNLNVVYVNTTIFWAQADYYSSNNQAMLFAGGTPDLFMIPSLANMVQVRLPSSNHSQFTSSGNPGLATPTGNIATDFPTNILMKISALSATLDALAGVGKPGRVRQAMTFAGMFSITEQEITSLMKTLHATTSGVVTNKTIYDASCAWLRSNTESWKRWIPQDSCNAGFEYKTQLQYCDECKLGYYKELTGNKPCTRCEPGTYGPKKRLTACSFCVGNMYASQSGMSECTTCPANSARQFRSAGIDASECKCFQNFYNPNGEYKIGVVHTCLPCPKGGVCLGDRDVHGSSSYAVPPYSADGYWASFQEPHRFFKCTVGTCLQGNLNYVNGTMSTVVGQNYTISKCPQKNGRYTQRGNMCAACTADTMHFDKECIPCETSFLWIVARLIMPLLLFLGWFPSIKTLVGDGILPSLFVSYAAIQIIGVIGTFPVEWSRIPEKTFWFMKIFNFDLDLTLIGCTLSDWSFTWIIYMILPILYWIYYMGSYFLNNIYARLKLSEEEHQKHLLGDRTRFLMAVKSALFICNLLYITVTTKALLIWKCESFVNGQLYLVYNPDIICFEGDHLWLMALSLIGIVCYTITCDR